MSQYMEREALIEQARKHVKVWDSPTPVHHTVWANDAADLLRQLVDVLATQPPAVAQVPLTDDQLADCVPDGAQIIEREGERNRVSMTRQQLHQFAANVLAAAPEAPAQANNLTAELQQRCSDWGVYWRAPDAHGVVLTVDQATELLRDALGVEVEVKAPAQAELTGCSCRWDKDDNRVQTCVRHQGWLDVVHEWAERAKDAEWKLILALEAPPQAAEVSWGVDWGVHGDRSCVSIIKKLPDGTMQVVATEFGPTQQAAPSAGEVERGDVVAFEFYNRATGHAIVDYSVNTHVGNLSAAKGYEARPLVYADKREEVTDGSKPIPAWQAREALDELEAAARGDAPFNHQAAAVVRAALSHKEPQR